MERAYIQRPCACKAGKGFVNAANTDEALVSGPAQGLV